MDRNKWRWDHHQNSTGGRPQAGFGRGGGGRGRRQGDWREGVRQGGMRDGGTAGSYYGPARRNAPPPRQQDSRLGYDEEVVAHYGPARRNAPPPTQDSSRLGYDEVVAQRASSKPIAFVDLMKQSLAERSKIVQALPEEAKLLLLYPEMETTGLPERDRFPNDWNRLVSRAKEATKMKIEGRFVKEETDSDDDSGSDSDFLIYGKDVVSRTDEKDKKEQHLFVDMCHTCLPIITYGFHVSIKHGVDDKFCFCPCDRDTSNGTVAGRVRSICGMENIVDKGCNKKGAVLQVNSGAFVHHVRDKMGSCKFHRILYDFLEELYCSFDGPGRNLFPTKQRRS
jgi:hypothetical protein